MLQNITNLLPNHDYVISNKLEYFQMLLEKQQVIILTLFTKTCEDIRKKYFCEIEDVLVGSNVPQKDKRYNVIITTPVYFVNIQDKLEITATHAIIYEPQLIDICGYKQTLQNIKNLRFIAHSTDLKTETFLQKPILVTANKKFYIKCKDEQSFFILYAIYKYKLLNGSIGLRVSEKYKKKYEIFMKVIVGEYKDTGSNIIVIGNLDVDDECDRIIYLTSAKKDIEEYKFDDKKVEKYKYRLRDLWNAISKGVCKGRKEFNFDRFKTLKIK